MDSCVHLSTLAETAEGAARGAASAGMNRQTVAAAVAAAIRTYVACRRTAAPDEDIQYRTVTLAKAIKVHSAIDEAMGRRRHNLGLALQSARKLQRQRNDATHTWPDLPTALEDTSDSSRGNRWRRRREKPMTSTVSQAVCDDHPMGARQQA